MAVFQQEKIIGFEYKRNGTDWHLSNYIFDAEVARIIGWEIFQKVPVITSYFPPQYIHLKKLLLELAKHKLDGGSIHETATENYYLLEVEVRARITKGGNPKENQPTPTSALAPATDEKQ